MEVPSAINVEQTGNFLEGQYVLLNEGSKQLIRYGDAFTIHFETLCLGLGIRRKMEKRCL